MALFKRRKVKETNTSEYTLTTKVIPYKLLGEPRVVERRLLSKRERRLLSKKDLEQMCGVDIPEGGFEAIVDARDTKWAYIPTSVMTAVGEIAIIGGTVYYFAARVPSYKAILCIELAGLGTMAAGDLLWSWKKGWRPGDNIKTAYAAISKYVTRA